MTGSSGRRFGRSLAVALRALAVAFALTIALSATARACPLTSLPDVEDEVMCPVCGTPLATAGGPQSERQRAFIRKRVDRCDTKAEIKSALVAEYGDAVLATPRRDGFQAAAYVVPVAGLLLALIALGFGAVRWRRAQAAPGGDAVGAAAPAPPGSARLDEDLQRYDL